MTDTFCYAGIVAVAGLTGTVIGGLDTAIAYAGTVGFFGWWLRGKFARLERKIDNLPCHTGKACKFKQPREPDTDL